LRIAVVAGTRPEIIKLAPVLWELRGRGLDYVFIWSGQHYDYEMSRVFMEELGVPEPDVSLGVGSGSHAVQTARLLTGLEEAFRETGAGLVTALGDTNTVLAAALSSVKMGIPFAHIEAGLRSWNMAMPEEVNRRAVDHVSQLLLAPCSLAAMNLAAEGFPSSMVRLTGNTIVDVVEACRGRIRGGWGDDYVLVTVHRQENTDDPSRLRSIFNAVGRLAERHRVIAPLHPRTRRRLEALGLLGALRGRGVEVLPPLGYFEFLGLLSNASLVLTDSGGVQEEAFTLHVPAVTLRYNTERPETVLLGGNILAGAEEDLIVEYSEEMLRHGSVIRRRLMEQPNPYGDGRAAARIVDALTERDWSIREPDMRLRPQLEYRLVEGHVDGDIVYGVGRDGRLTPGLPGDAGSLVRLGIGAGKPWAG